MREREEKRKIRKGKVILTIIAVVAIIAIIVGIVFLVKSKIGGSGTQEEVNDVYELPDVTYSDMQVTDVEMEYLKRNDETMVSMIINNTTQNTVSQESLTAILLNEKGETVGETRTYIESLAPGEQYSISVVLDGDLTSTTQIKLQK